MDIETGRFGKRMDGLNKIKQNPRIDQESNFKCFFVDESEGTPGWGKEGVDRNGD
jgi:hypothetical protein